MNGRMQKKNQINGGVNSNKKHTLPIVYLVNILE
jgi:hypothetical protein